MSGIWCRQHVLLYMHVKLFSFGAEQCYLSELPETIEKKFDLIFKKVITNYVYIVRNLTLYIDTLIVKKCKI